MENWVLFVIILYTNKMDHIWKTDKLISKDVCFECGSDYAIHFHHVVPKSKGGKNAIPLCEKCHGLVHNRKFNEHRILQMEGIERAKLNGKYKGRNGGTIETPEKFMGKEKIQKVMIELLNGKRSSVISTEINIHMNTITKIKKYMKRYPELVPSV